MTATAGKGAAAWLLDVMKALIPGVVLAVIGFVLNDTVDQALKEHTLQLDAVKDMQSLSAELQKPDIERDAALAHAAQLAAYGKYSVPFFINVQEIGNQYGVLGALQGLRMVARSEPQSVCDAVSAIVRNRTALYRWQSHLAALKLIGEIRCEEAQGEVDEYRKSLVSLATLVTWVAAPAPEQAEFDELGAEVQAAAERLRRPVPTAPSRGWFGRGGNSGQ